MGKETMNEISSKSRYISQKPMNDKHIGHNVAIDLRGHLLLELTLSNLFQVSNVPF